MKGKEGQRILDWLSDLNFAPDLQDNLGQWQKGTGQWFLDTQQYQDWYEGVVNMLWCKGMRM
jgi:hypothetical protein